MGEVPPYRTETTPSNTLLELSVPSAFETQYPPPFIVPALGRQHRESGPPGAVHLSRHKWPGGSINQDLLSSHTEVPTNPKP